jgi:hypothetical protein
VTKVVGLLDLQPDVTPARVHWILDVAGGINQRHGERSRRNGKGENNGESANHLSLANH